MMFSQTNRQPRRKGRARKRVRLHPVLLFLEPLEDRLAPAQITVLTNSDAVSHTGMSLRDAVVQANMDAAAGTSDTIMFDSSLAGQTITLVQGQIELSGAGTGTITIDGGGAITISGAGASRIFQIDTGVQATLTGLTIEDGLAQNANGGGILNKGTLNLSDATLTGNTATQFRANGGSGGGIYNSSGNLTLTQVTLIDNWSNLGGGMYNASGTVTVSDTTLSGNVGTGGGIYNDSGTLTLTRATVEGNSAFTGGGIYNSAGNVTISDSTFAGNRVQGSGGGIYTIDGAVPGSLTVSDSTFYGNDAVIGGGIYNESSDVTVTDSALLNNTAQYSGGGIYSDATITVTDSTLSGNSAKSGGGIYTLAGTLTLSSVTLSANSASDGGGIFSYRNFQGHTSAITLLNTIIAGNSAATAADFDAGGGTISGDNNLIATNAGLSGSGISDGTNGNIVGHAALLSALANYGGPSQTFALLPGSPALGAGAADTTVTSAAAAGDTTLSVADAAAIASTPGDYLIQIDSEQMQVTDVDVATNTLTVTRGVNGTTPAAHSVNAAVYLATDQRGLPRLVSGSEDMGALQTQATSSLVFTTASQVLSAGQPATIGVQLVGPSGTVAQAGAGGLTLTLSSSSGTGAFLDGAGHSLATPNVTMPQGASNATFMYEDAAGGQPTLTVTAPGYAAITQQEQVAPITVTTASDAPGHSGTSLRDAVAEADSEAVAGVSPTIVFDSSLAGDTITLTQGQLGLSGTAVITIDGGGQITISGNNQSRVFQVDASAQAVLEGLNITAGLADNGGGILNDGSLTVSNSTLSGNSASLNGGAIATDADLDTLTVSNSTLSGNAAGSNGGAISTFFTTFTLGSATVINSTLSGNSAGAAGGGVYSDIAHLFLTNDTIAGNTAATGGGLLSGNINDTLRNTIIAGNTAPTGPDIKGYIGGSNNLIGSPSGMAGISDGSQGNIVGHPALLSALGSYGGPLQTIGLLPGSPAIGAGGPLTSLRIAIGTSDPTIQLTSGTVVPSGPGAFYIQVDSEQMEVTNVSYSTLTVIRGVNGTTAAAHAANAAITLPTDERGVSRPVGSPADMGAFQSRGFALAVVSGDSPQTGLVNSAFPNPLAVSVSPNAAGEPVDGGVVAYVVAAGTDGQSATLSSATATISSGQASVTATANAVVGSYQVSATAVGAASPATFNLTNAASITVAVFTTAAQTITAGQPSADITVELQDQHGNVVPAGAGGVTFDLTTSAATGVFLDTSGQPLAGNSLTIAQGSSTLSFEYEDTKTGTPTLAALGPGMTATQQETIQAASPSAALFTTSPQTITAGQPSAVITVELLDSFGNVAQAGSGGLVFALSTNSNAGSFLDSGGNPMPPSLTLAQGSSVGSLEYEDTKAGTPTLSAAASGFSVVTQRETIQAAAASVVIFATAAQTLEVGQASGNITVQLEDLYGNVAQAGGGGLGLTLSSTSPGGTFLDNTGLALPSPAITIPQGASTGSFEYADAQAGTPTLTAAASAFSATQQLNVFDLTVTNITVPTTILNNQNLIVSWTDQNNATISANGPWVDNVYYSTSSTGASPALLGTFSFPNSLAAGATVVLTQAVSLPSILGNIWIVVQTNANTQVNQDPIGLINTAIAGPVDIIQTPLPDLVVTGITPPSNVLAGTSVPVTYTVTNKGNAPTNAAQWLDGVFLSQSPALTLTGNDFYDGFEIMTQPIGVPVFVTNPSYLEPGQSYSQTVNVPFPVSASGTWYVYVVTNRSFTHTPLDNFLDVGPLRESSSINDLTASAPFTVSLGATPDLAVSNVQTPPDAFSGQTMNVSWTVTNQGTGIAIGQALRGGGAATGPYLPTLPADSTWTDEVFMSPDATLDSKAVALGTFTHDGALEPAGSYTDSEQLNLPVGVSGSFYFIVQTDMNGQVFENGALSNNIEATPSPITVNLTPPPDLITSITSAPLAALAGHNLTFTYQVSNTGAGATVKINPNGTWQDAYYLSPTPNLNLATAILIGQQTYSNSLDAGASYQPTVTESLPNGLSGSYYLIVDADSGGVIFELDETGKLGASTAPIQVSSKPPDLIVSAAGAPPTAQAGATALVSWTVANQGTGDTVVTSWQDDVYADRTSTLTSNAILLSSFTHTGLLNAGDSYNQAQLVPLPISLSGSYYLFVVTNEAVPPAPPLPRPVSESDFTNDMSAPLPITVGQSLSDLQVGSVMAPATAHAGASVMVSWTVLNNGAATTNSDYWYDDVWLSTNTTLASGGSDFYLGTLQHTNPLAAAGNYSASLAVTVPASLPAGNYHFVVATDRPVLPPGADPNTGNLVYESNEANNETAANTTNVTPGPNLIVSNVTAPGSTTVGQPLAVGWTVTNNGAGATGDVPIQDSVYLSYDQVFGPGSIYVGTVTQDGGLAAGAHYTQNANLLLPSGLTGTFYVFVATDTNNTVYERNPANAVADDPTPLQITLPPLADLLAGTVTLPANAVPGQNITITYQVTNQSSNPANGAWYDALYLSPTSTWSVNAPLLGRVYEDQDLAGGTSYTGTLTAPLPAVAPGSYYVIVRSNILDTMPEVTFSNNLSASLTQTSIDVPALTLGTAMPGTLGNAQSAFYKVVVDAGQTLQISFNSEDPASLNELYVSFGTVPTRSQADYRFSALAANQQITVPATQAGTYYILAYASSVTLSPESYSITAALVPFAIQTVSPGTVGAGTATVEIDGSKFDNNTTFQLLGNGTVVNDQTVFLQDSSTAFVTFNLAGTPLGTYDVQATHADGTTTKLSQSLAVVAATPANVGIYLSTPDEVLPGSQSVVTVNFTNTSNTDAMAPLMQLSADNALLRLEDQAAFSGNTVTFLGISSTGPAGILRPGESDLISIPFRATGVVGTNINFNIGTIDDSQVMDWASQEAALQPSIIPDQAWPAVFANFVSDVGNTGASYNAALAADASYLSRFGETTYDTAQLAAFEIQSSSATFTAESPLSSLDDTLPSPGLALVMQRTRLTGIAGHYYQGMFGYGWTNTWDYSASTDANGNAVINRGGSRIFFTPQPDGSFQSDSGSGETLTLSSGAYRLMKQDGSAVQFNPNGTLAYQEDANGNRVTAGYNAAGQLVSLTTNTGAHFQFTYNSSGHITTLTDSSGTVITYTYDASGQFLIGCTGPGGTTSYTYVSNESPAQNNALASITNPDGSNDYFAYDNQGRLIDEHADGGAGDVQYSYIGFGGFTATNARGDTTTVFANTLGQIAEVIDPLGNVTRYDYDNNGDLTRVIDARGDVASYKYDGQGNLISQTDPLGNTVHFAYDGAGDVTSYTDALGNTTRYTYDGNHNTLSVLFPDGTSQQSIYNSLGEVQQFIDANGTVANFTYNSQGLIRAEQFSDGTSYQFTYTSGGQMLTATDGAGNVTAFTYGDPANPDLPTRVSYPNGTFLTITYNAHGQRIQMADQTGFVTKYTYDPAGQLLQLTDGSGNLIVRYSYDTTSLLVQKDNGNGTRTVYTYDALGDVVSITNYAADHKTVNSFDIYTYDGVHDVLTDTSQDGEWTYTYDADSNLIHAVFSSADTAVLPNQDESYAYDANGNLITKTINGVVTMYAVNNVGEAISASTAGVTTAYKYDANGNLVAQTTGSVTTTYSFDVTNQLVGITSPTQSQAFQYDALGNLVASTTNGRTVEYAVDLFQRNIVGEYDSAGNVIAHFITGLSLVSQVSAGNVASYYDFNAVGSTVGITGAAGTYVNRYAYSPFGNTTVLSSSLSNPFTFVGASGVQDRTGGVYVMGQRVYDTGLNRFLSADPASIYGAHDYRYAGNNPTTFIDPSGLMAGYGTINGWNESVAPHPFTGDESNTEAITKGHSTLYNPKYNDPTTGKPDPCVRIHEYTHIWQNDHPYLKVFANPATTVYVALYGFAGEEKFHYANDNLLNEVPAYFAEIIDPDCKDKDKKNEAWGWIWSFWTNPFQHYNPRKRDGSRIEAPHDPNNIIGPAGFGDASFVSLNQLLPYQIDFENEPTAGLPAQQVVVTQQLDPSLNWASFRLGSFGFGGTTYPVPANTAFYETQIDLTEQDGFYVDVSATIDERTGIATWVFTTIDPATGELPLDPSIGFLPPDKANGIGAGFVSYTVLAKSSDTTGTVINAQATVDFYTQPPINTPQIFNTIDAGSGLSSSVAPLPAFQTSATFPVAWSGIDGSSGSAVSDFTIYVSDDGGPYTIWLADTSATAALFTGQYGHSYSFYSIAGDNAGNSQAAPGPVQTTAVLGDHIVLSFPDTQPAEPIAGGSFAVTAQVIGNDGQPDTHFSGSIALGVTGGPGTLSGTTIATVENGIATFTNLSLNTAGNYTLFAASDDDVLGGTVSLDILPAPHFTVTLTPAPGNANSTAGLAYSVTVTAVGSAGTETNYLGTVHFTSSDSQAVLPASDPNNPQALQPNDYTFQPGDHGVHMFTNIVLKTAGKETVTIADNSLPGTQTASNAVSVKAAAAAGFTISAGTTPIISGVPHSFTVTPVDQYGNQNTGYQGTVTVTSSTEDISTPLSVKVSRGNGTFTATLKTLGNQTLTATQGSLAGTQSVAVYSTATNLLLTLPAGPITAGQPVMVTVTAQTAGGQTVKDFPDPFTLSASDKLAFFSNTPSGFLFTNGVATFDVTFETAGSQTLAVHDALLASVQGKLKVNVQAGSVSAFQITGLPSPDVSGTAQKITVKAVDIYNNVVTAFGGKVQLTSTDPSAKLPATGTTKHGVATFSGVTLVTPGIWSFFAGQPGGINTSDDVTVLSAATHFAVKFPPAASFVAGQPITVTVTALTAANKPDKFFADTINLTSSDSAAQFAPASLTLSNGTGTFTVTFATFGSQTVTLTDSVRPSIRTTSAPVKIVSSTLPHLTASVSGPALPGVAGTVTTAVPGQPLTFTFTAGDSAQPSSATFTYRIDWSGNGKVVQTVTAPGTITLSHAYTTTGNDMVKVIVLDGAGNASAPATTASIMIQTIAMETDPADNTQTALAIGGGGAIMISPTDVPATPVSVTINNKVQSLPAPPTPLGEILVFGQGASTIQEAAKTFAGHTVAVNIPALLFAGPGTSTISVAGSSADNVLVGGGGKVALTGGSGRDILIGGGPAALHAGSGDDLLIAGTTRYDADITALLAIAREWDSGLSFQERIQDLFGNGAGGQNGADLLNAQTVTRETAISQLVGGAGNDWFWFARNSKSSDKVSGFTDGDAATFE
jgi:RHS repeat-associated protein